MDQAKNFIRAVLDGMTGAGLFRKLTYPDAPTEFVDSRPVEEILRSRPIEEILKRFRHGWMKGS